MDNTDRLIEIDFDKLKKNTKNDPNTNEEIIIKSNILNRKSPLESDVHNFKMNRNNVLKALQRHTFWQETSLFFNTLYYSGNYTERSIDYGRNFRLLKKRGKPSCIVGSRNLQLTLNLLKE